MCKCIYILILITYTNIIHIDRQIDRQIDGFKQNSILKFQDKICRENVLFISKTLNNLSLSVFNSWFRFSSDQQNYETSSSAQGNLIKLFYKPKRYGKHSITVSAVESWNKIKKQLKDLLLRDLSPNKIKMIVSDIYLKSYY